MLKAGMAESVNEQVVITDIEVDIMEKVIEFMYTGVIDPIPGFNDLEEIVTKSQIVALEDFADLYRRKPEILFEFIIRIANV
ncbi:hypothetical protein PV325_002331 [Microctonus aethiopoides]|nr:hypothetical protein PV325_002331 [Microctonus aethiopoides]